MARTIACQVTVVFIAGTTERKLTTTYRTRKAAEAAAAALAQADGVRVESITPILAGGSLNAGYYPLTLT
jgi:hypothetical protein